MIFTHLLHGILGGTEDLVKSTEFISRIRKFLVQAHDFGILICVGSACGSLRCPTGLIQLNLQGLYLLERCIDGRFRLGKVLASSLQLKCLV